ncbi:flagellar basal body P-ring protein FlgI [Photobacterium toruni]|uniref:flagellar basal body P-ring protein FlgI n=1 Tax=Photobacterium toruni TaxID=1935446 RepID=UPI00210F25DC|nr:flagellar basal body P-ring protein FlgI [Photobacterium toruni]
MKLIAKTIISTALYLFLTQQSYADQIKDIAIIEGVRENQLQGYGLVVGLQGTGDRNTFVNKSLATQLNKYGIRVPDNISLNSRNAAVVMTTATLPAFIKDGQQIDVTISSIGNSKSLRGGTLVTSPLLGLDGKVYAIAQGQVLVDGYMSEGLSGSTIQVNTASVGRIPDGAIVEKQVNTGFSGHKTLDLLLNHPNFETSANIAKAINAAFGKGAATAKDAGAVSVRMPEGDQAKIEFLGLVNNLNVKVGKPEATVVINSRSGTVTMSEDVHIWPVAISEGNFTINIFESEDVSQPAPFSSGTTIKIKNSEISLKQKQQEISLVSPKGATLSDLVDALNKMGTAHSDLTHILQLLAKSGSLRAKILVI